jgi:CRISP-associated protein Cas1
MSHRTLTEAWDRVRSNAGGPGVDGVSVEDFERNCEVQLKALPRAVLAGTYSPSPLREILIAKDRDEALNPPAEIRYRRLAVPTVGDRVLQTAVAMQLTPILEREFEAVSYAYRRGKSVQQAVARVEQLRDDGFVWVVDADIELFFDSIPHAPLGEALQGITRDTRLTLLVRDWLRAPILTVNGELQERLLGVPQGSPLSPLLSNLYLDSLDEAMIDADHRIVRFADDFVILCRNQARAIDALELTESVLSALALRLNSEKTRIVDFNQGFTFLGVNFVRSMAVARKSSRTNHMTRATTAPHLTEDELDAVQTNYRATRAPRTPSQYQRKRSDRGTAVWTEYTHGGAIQAAIRQLPPGPFEQHVPAHSPANAASHEDLADVRTSDERTISSPSPSNAVLDLPIGLPPGNGPADTLARALPVLRTLYLIEQGSVTKRDGEQLVVTIEAETVCEVGIPQLDLVMAFGGVTLTTGVIQACMVEGIPIVYSARTGKLYGIAVGADVNHAPLLRNQVLATTFDFKRLDYARTFVRAKLTNARTLIKRLSRARTGHTELVAMLHAASLRIRDAGWRTKTAQTLDALRGLEGAAAVAYFGALRAVLPSGWTFGARVAFPAPDAINAMLSFGYALLRGNIVAMLNSQGLSPQLGFLHADSAGHSALASDLMEEFRSLVVDALVIELVSHRRLAPEDFVDDESGAVRMNTSAIKTFIHAFEQRMQSPIAVRDTANSHREPTSLRHRMLQQVQELSRALRTDDRYAPFVGR